MSTQAIAVKERPILFSGQMVNAILGGQKTQTRRVIANVPEGVTDVTHNNSRDIWFWWDGRLAGEVINRYGKPGDRLWVREAHSVQPCNCCVRYKADDNLLDAGEKWKPSIHMPRWASRITLEITNVRVERLQDISEADAEAEGVQIPVTAKGNWARCISSQYIPQEPTFREHFRMLWEEKNGKKFPWGSNPWVWVVSFRRVDAL